MLAMAISACFALEGLVGFTSADLPDAGTYTAIDFVAGVLQ